MKKADHLAINKAIEDYEKHCAMLLKLASNRPLTEFQVLELISSEVGYGMTLIANHLLEFGEKEE